MNILKSFRRPKIDAVRNSACAHSLALQDNV